MMSTKGFRIPCAAFSSTTSKFIPVANRVALKKYAHVSVYKRNEPEIGVNFIEEHSKKLLLECLQENTANNFFEIIDQFQTQSDPSYCGPTNLMTMLNTLKIDPKTKWKGIWRWYDEDIIKCLDIERIKDYGMTLNEFAMILKCNGLKSKVYRPDTYNNISPEIDLIKIPITSEDLLKNDYNCLKHIDTCLNSKKHIARFSFVDYAFFQAASLASTKWNKFFLMCNLGRGGLNQTGDGHFTPLAAYHQKENLGLLLESARFKYNSRWFDLQTIYKSLIEKDQLADLSRGFLLIHKVNPSINKTYLQSLSLSKIKDSITLINKKTIDDLLTLNRKAYLINHFMTNKVQLPNKQIINDDIIKTLQHFNSTSSTFNKLTHFLHQFDNSNLINNILNLLSQPHANLFKKLT